MLIAAKGIINTIASLKRFQSTINNKTGIEKIRSRIKTDLYNIMRMAQELECIYDYDENHTFRRGYFLDIERRAKTLLSQLPEIEDLEVFKSICNEYADMDTFYFKNLETYNCMNYVMDYEAKVIDSIKCEEDITVRDTSKIFDSINIKRSFNAFSTRAGSGASLLNMKILFDDRITTYGLESRENLYLEARECLDRAIKGQTVGSRISNDTFDVLYVNPDITWSAYQDESGGQKEKAERKALKDDIKYARKNAIIILRLPYYRLTRDMNVIIAKTLKNVSVIKKSGIGKEIIIIGTKDIAKETRMDIFNLLSEIEYDTLKDRININYELPLGPIKEPEIFRGSKIDDNEVKDVIESSGLIESFWSEMRKTHDDENSKPLLPFNMGQIGLILTSGCLDGTVEEYEGQHHAIKGMVTKVKHSKSETENGEESCTDIITNKVQINLITPNGEFVELT